MPRPSWSTQSQNGKNNVSRKFFALLLASTQLYSAVNTARRNSVTPAPSPNASPSPIPRSVVDMKVDTKEEMNELPPLHLDTDTPSPKPQQNQQTFNYNTPPPSPSNSGFLLCAVALGAVAIAAQTPERTPPGKPAKSPRNELPPAGL